ELTATLKAGVGLVAVHGFRAEHDGIVYLAAYAECHARLDIYEYRTILDVPLDRWVPGAGRRRELGERLLRGQMIPGAPREADFGLSSRKGGHKWIARRRWMERQGFLYQAIAVMPATRAESADVARFLDSLESVPIALDRRGLTPSWRRTRCGDDGFAVLWP